MRAFGISRDSPWTHIAWVQALDLDVVLLSDWNAEAVRGFGVAQDYRGLRDVAQRSALSGRGAAIAEVGISDEQRAAGRRLDPGVEKLDGRVAVRAANRSN